jgi:hypothetical protein
MSERLITKRGQLELSVATGLAAISFVAAPIIAYFTAQLSTQQKINDVSERVVRVEVLKTSKRH